LPKDTKDHLIGALDDAENCVVARKAKKSSLLSQFTILAYGWEQTYAENGSKIVQTNGPHIAGLS
jgi:hypothetical protein